MFKFFSRIDSFPWYLIAFLIGSSCNLTQQYIKKSNKVYAKLGVEEKLIKVDSSTIFLRKVGTGETKLVLIHGFGPLPQVQWEEMTKELSDEFQLFIPDMVFFGESIGEKPNYSPAYQANQITKALKKEGLTKYYVAGLSYGGMVAALMASDQHQEINGLILLDALSKFSDRSYTDSLAQANGAKDAAEFLLPQNGKSMKRLFRMTYYKPPKYPAFLLNKPARVLYNNSGNHKNLMIQYLRENGEALKEWEVNYEGPTQIIWGKKDRLIPLKNATSLNKYYPNSQLSVIPKSAHVPNIENSKEVAEIIRLFIKKVESNEFF